MPRKIQELKERVEAIEEKVSKTPKSFEKRDWWYRMSPKQRHHYKKKHPKTDLAK